MKKTILQIRTLLIVAISFFSLASVAQSDKGVLLVNEFSNGEKGNKEWCELMVANNVGGIQNTVDITGWLFDDNNGIFNDFTVPGAAISPGHLRFANDSYWENVKVGTFVVLFNGKDTSKFDYTDTLFNNAFLDANGVYAVDNGVDLFIFVAVGKSPYIEYKAQLPIVGVNYLRGYCSQDLYTAADTISWNSVELGNGDDSLGDGFQVRCPGCIDNPNFTDMPGFYHGVSYGKQNHHISTSDSSVGVDGPNIIINDTLGGFQKAFEFFQGTTNNSIGEDTNWRHIPYTSATPGRPNSSDNNTFWGLVKGLTNKYPLCFEFEPDTTPVKGVLVVTEFANGSNTLSSQCEYIELLVATCEGTDPSVSEVDIRGWIVDDNNGVFGTSGISAGHLKFADLDTLKKVPVGTVIILFNGTTGTPSQNCYNFVVDQDYSDSTLVLQIDGSSPTSFIVNNKAAGSIVVKPRTNPSLDTTYCPAAYEASALDWNGKVGLGNTVDGVQVRCPECEPVFYHGAAYGTAASPRAQTASDLGGPVVATGSGTNKTYILNSGACNVGTAGSWTVITSPTTATPPATAGVVDTSVYNAIIVNRTCAFPCCVAPSSKTGSIDNMNNMELPGFMVGNAYPNPANNELNIDINSNEDFTLTFVDITGRVIYSQNYKATNGLSTVTVNLADISTGTYFFNVVTNTNNHTSRVVISR